jgi:uncharacterized membrane protein
MHMSVAGSDAGTLAVLVVLWGVITTIFWMIIAWRAMRAHEALAQATWHLARSVPRIASTNRGPGAGGPS